MKKIDFILAAALLAASLSGCGRTGYDDFSVPEQGASTLRPVEDIYRDNSSESLVPVREKPDRTVASSDGLCVIECRDSYYDVTLDYEKGSYYDVGAAYAEAILLARDDYTEFLEGYIFENIKAAFNDLDDDYTGIENRTEKFRSALSKDYADELQGFADGISGDSHGIREDGIISAEEAALLQFIPDVLRGTACSAISADGNVTTTGKRLTCRLLEWQLGSDNQICSAHAVVHMKNGEKSFVSVSALGFLTILTAVNDDGVMLGELDVGSSNMVEYSCEDKTSYTYDIRFALENFSTAREAAEYLTANAHRYPYCVNVLATDRDDAVVAELAVNPEDGSPLIRDSSTPLFNGIRWDSPDYICTVNSFAAEGNSDKLSFHPNNIIRWNRYNELFCGEKQLSPERMRQLMTSERTDNNLVRIRSSELMHMVIADYSTCSLQAILTDTEGVTDEQKFIDLGSWK